MMVDMEILDGLVISNHRCLFDRTTGALAIADLHLGYEGAAKDDGVYFPRVQKDEMMEGLSKVLDRYSPRTVVVDGDLKHTFDRRLFQEWQEIQEVFDLLAGGGREVRIVRGNHDNFVAGSIPRGTELEPMSIIGRLQVTHGHKMEALPEGRARGMVLVLGHEHPSALLKDTIGAAVRLPCFLWHPEEEILILPAFSRLTPGSDVLSRGFLSPFLEELEPGEFLTYGVSEIGLLELGRLCDLSGPLTARQDRIS